MEIGGHPPIPLAQNNCPLWQFPGYFFTIFQVPNFRARFEALNDIFGDSDGKRWVPSARSFPQPSLAIVL